MWPAGAYEARISGRWSPRACGIDRFGLAEWCKIAAEKPSGRGFGQAALEMRPTFKLKPPVGPDGPTDAVLNVAVEFRAPEPMIDFGRARDGGPVGERAGPPSMSRPQEVDLGHRDGAARWFAGLSPC